MKVQQSFAADRRLYSPSPAFTPRITALCGLAGLGLFVLGLSGCGGDDAVGQGPPPKPPSLVRAAQMEQKMISRRIEVVGNVTPVRTSVVASGANGVVQYLSEAPAEGKENYPNAVPSLSPGEQNSLPAEIEAGQYVPEGTVLSVLRMEATDNELAEARAIEKERLHKLEAVKNVHPKELVHAEAMMKMAEAVKNNAEQKWTRTKSLYDRGVANESEMEDALEKWRAAQQSLVAAQQKYEQIKAGLDIEQADASLEAQKSHVAYLESEKIKRTTRAPFSGFVVQVHTYKGQWLSKGDPVVTLAKMDEVDVVVHIDQADMPYVQLGQLAKVVVQGAPKRDWTGRIVHIVPQSDWAKGSRGFPVVVRIKNNLEGQKQESTEAKSVSEPFVPLKAGMLARVTIEGPPVETLLVPKDALVRTTRGTDVYVFTPQDPTAKLNPKEPTMGSVQQVPIMADLHMSDGEMIGVTLANEMPGGQNPLKPGAWVVTEGGERFVAPVQDNVNALSRVGDSTMDK